MATYQKYTNNEEQKPLSPSVQPSLKWTGALWEAGVSRMKVAPEMNLYFSHQL